MPDELVVDVAIEYVEIHKMSEVLGAVFYDYVKSDFEWPDVPDSDKPSVQDLRLGPSVAMQFVALGSSYPDYIIIELRDAEEYQAVSPQLLGAAIWVEVEPLIKLGVGAERTLRLPISVLSDCMPRWADLAELLRSGKLAQLPDPVGWAQFLAVMKDIGAHPKDEQELLAWLDSLQEDPKTE